MSMNQWHGIGNLTRDPETRTASGDLNICTFSVAVNRAKDRDGNSKADFIPVKALGKKADVCSKYLHKGSRIGVTGMLSTYTYEGDDGKKHFKMEVLLDELTFLGDNASSGSGHAEPPAQQPQQGSGYKPGDFTEVDDDELPF